MDLQRGFHIQINLGMTNEYHSGHGDENPQKSTGILAGTQTRWPTPLSLKLSPDVSNGTSMNTGRGKPITPNDIFVT